MSSRQRVTLIASGEAAYRAYLVDLVTAECAVTEVIAAASFGQALATLSARADIALADIALAALDLAAPMARHALDLRRLRTGFPNMRLVILAASDDRVEILAALRAGAHAYIPKALGAAAIGEALRAVAQGDIFVPAALSALPRNAAVPASGGASPSRRPSELTPRQKDVFLLMQRGLRNKEIARALDLSENTIKVHAYALFRKIGITRRKELVAALLAVKH
jgi:DNA-binding NarL/FixJ family response regulator